MAEGKVSTDDDVTIIERYPNRRLYDTNASGYVGLDHLRGMLRERRKFLIYDVPSGDDITQSVMTKISEG